MKRGKTIRKIFTLVGGIVGAGFLSGRELVDFFGRFDPYLLAVCFLFLAVELRLFLSLGKKYGGWEGLCLSLPNPVRVLFKVGALLSSAVTAIAMLSAVHALYPSLSPYLALLTFAVSLFVQKKGIGGIGTVNLIITPILLFAVVWLALSKGTLSPWERVIPTKYGVLSVVMYASYNAFMLLPLAVETGKEGEGRKIAWSVSGTVCLFAGFVLSVVCYDKSSFSVELPLPTILGGKKFFSVLAYFGLWTTLLSSTYPLAVWGQKVGRIGRWAVAVGILLLSFLPFSSIVGKVYPALSFCGIAVVGYFVLREGAHKIKKLPWRCHGSKKVQKVKR